jgi:gliding motility-associated-like protein
LNGSWTITVTDHLLIDNGYIFGWSIDFDPALLPGSYSFIPDFPQEGWQANPDIIATTNNGHDIEIKPQSGGLKCYTYAVTDNFGCDYDTSICVYVRDPGNPGADTSFNLCLNQGTINALDYLGGNPDPGGLWSGPGMNANGNFNPNTAGIGQHDLVYTKSNGNCDTIATIHVNVVNDVLIDFDFDIRPGCSQDTVQFTNTSEPGLYWWNFGDGSSPDDTTMNPMHIYLQQNQYPVRLMVQNGNGCRDSLVKLVSVYHPLIAGFTQSEDSVCQAAGTMVQLSDTSTGASGYFWDFGDGTTSNLQNPSHIYSLAGTHQIIQVIRDNIPCYDTAVHSIFVDSLPYLDLITDKTDICQGDEVNFTLNYLQPSLDVHWNFGDNIHWEEALGTSHSYDQEGNYMVTVQVDYPVCPATHDTVAITVHPFPVVDLGPDSVLCLDGNPILLRNLYTANDPLTTWRWNTGDSSETLQVVHPGTYSLTGTLIECSTTESVKIDKDCYIDMPNAFSPDGDGENDYFFPRQYLSQGVIAFSMNIFNRWGQKVFETTSTTGRGWDGRFNDKEQPMGVYIYNITVKYKNGRDEKYTGNVTLIR